MRRMFSQNQLKRQSEKIAKDAVAVYSPYYADIEAKQEVARYDNYENNVPCACSTVSPQGLTRTRGQRGALANRGVLNFYFDGTWVNLQQETTRSIDFSVSWQFYDSSCAEQWLPYLDHILCKDGKMASDEAHVITNYYEVCNATLFINGEAHAVPVKYRNRTLNVSWETITLAPGTEVNFDIQFSIQLMKTA